MELGPLERPVKATVAGVVHKTLIKPGRAQADKKEKSAPEGPGDP